MMAENTTNENKSKVAEDNKNREFLLNKHISADNVEKIIKGILEINRYDDKERKKDHTYIRKPIKLIIDSFGGSIHCGNALAGIIDTSETPVHGYCYGKAMSQAFMIFAICHKRFAHPIATFMYHDGGSTFRGLTEQIQLDIDELRRLVAIGDEFLVRDTKLTKEKLEKIKKSRLNWYMDAKEALEWGIVDEILESKRNKNT